MSQVSRFIFFLFTLFCAFLVSFVVYKKIAGKSGSTQKQASAGMVSTVIANKNLERGEKITITDVSTAQYFQESLPPGYFVSTEELAGRIVLVPVVAKRPILESDLAPKDVTKGGLASLIPGDKRAMSVKVDNIIGVAGFIQPGHLVDVIVSLDGNGEGEKKISKTVLENIPVLSVGSQSQETDDKKAKQITVATLEVSLDEGEKLSTAVNQGKIQLALRNYTDKQQVKTKGVNLASLLRSYSSENFEPVKDSGPVVAEPAPMPAPPKMVIEVMNGNKVEQVKLSR